MKKDTAETSKTQSEEGIYLKYIYTYKPIQQYRCIVICSLGLTVKCLGMPAEKGVSKDVQARLVHYVTVILCFGAEDRHLMNRFKINYRMK